jgi:hypothetical protein
MSDHRNRLADEIRETLSEPPGLTASELAGRQHSLYLLIRLHQ